MPRVRYQHYCGHVSTVSAFVCCAACSPTCTACIVDILRRETDCDCDACITVYYNAQSNARNGTDAARSNECMVRRVRADEAEDNVTNNDGGNMPREISIPWNRAFGVEIECNNGRWGGTYELAQDVADALTAQAGSRVVVESDDEEGNLGLYTLSNGWGVCYDGSCGYEIKSPLLFGNDGINSVASVMRAMESIGCVTRSDCGIHIHVDTRDVRREPRRMRNLAAMVARTEEVFFGVVNRSRHGNSFCRFFNDSTLSRMAKAETLEDVLLAWYCGASNLSASEREYELRHIYNSRTEHYHNSRYFGANLHSTFYRGSVEFRYFNSTVRRVDLVQSWIVLAVATVEYAARANVLRYPKRVSARFGNDGMPKRFARLLKTFANGSVLGDFPHAVSEVLARRMTARINREVTNPVAQRIY